MDASLYWLDEDAATSFVRVCDFLIAHGMETTSEEIDTKGQGFIAGRHKRKGGKQGQRSVLPLGRVHVGYEPISDVARARGDHPAIEVAWPSYADLHPDMPEHEVERIGLQEYRFFTALCAELQPLYASMAGAGMLDCAYDMLHDERAGPSATFYCADALFGDAAAAFWASYAYSKLVGAGTYGTDLAFWNPRRRGVRLLGSSPSVRATIFLPALRLAYRSYTSGRM